jgi:hypothetical protein
MLLLKNKIYTIVFSTKKKKKETKTKQNKTFFAADIFES